MRSGSSAAFAALLTLAATSAHAEEDVPTPAATEPGVHPTLLWFATQLVPSPEIAAGAGGARFGLRWQVTPLLYSWGINRRLSPWRVLVAEPYVRQSGSIEAYLSPELITGGITFSDMWLVRPGIRAYFPLVEHGEYLSVSIGTSYQRWRERSSAAFEGGVYTLFGVLGLQLTYAPGPDVPLATIATMRIRYF